MEFPGVASVIAITVICYLVGIGIKASNLNHDFIPVIVGICGAILGIIGMKVMPEFPANNIIDALAVGIVSGLAATGINQITKIGNDK